MVYSPLLTGGLSQPLMRLVVDENPSKSDDVHDQWLIRNVPRTAKLSVKIFDKDNDKVKDDYIGSFELSLRPRNCRSTESINSWGKTQTLGPYTFDGPVRYSGHSLLAVGQLTKKQKWSPSYRAAQAIFEGPVSLGVQSLIKQVHHMLSPKHTTNRFGALNTSHDFWKLFEIGAPVFLDFASKHGLHANCSETVCYAEEMHPRPICGWDRFTSASQVDCDQWELVIGNGSSTYPPDRSLLVKLKD
ncbi:unnamed protein product [Rotaria socialis]|uniref:Uncharacterized protein n=1 Tax=Rotaria socialis TaxID=392032 RepID=A0A820XAA8_9BILA|nr:unnamed protein product [Rotaria socialis]CAF4529020.1 unnamed protein product [Rotaria socialis]